MPVVSSNGGKIVIKESLAARIIAPAGYEATGFTHLGAGTGEWTFTKTGITERQALYYEAGTTATGGARIMEARAPTAAELYPQAATPITSAPLPTPTPSAEVTPIAPAARMTTTEQMKALGFGVTPAEAYKPATVPAYLQKEKIGMISPILTSIEPIIKEKIPKYEPVFYEQKLTQQQKDIYEIKKDIYGEEAASAPMTWAQFQYAGSETGLPFIRQLAGGVAVGALLAIPSGIEFGKGLLTKPVETITQLPESIFTALKSPMGIGELVGQIAVGQVMGIGIKKATPITTEVLRLPTIKEKMWTYAGITTRGGKGIIGVGTEGISIGVPKITPLLKLIEQPTTTFGTAVITKSLEKVIFEPTKMLIEGKKISPELQRTFFTKSLELEKIVSKVGETPTEFFKAERLTDPTRALTRIGVEKTIFEAQRIVGKPKEAIPFGSYALRTQLAPDVLRTAGDIDIWITGKRQPEFYAAGAKQIAKAYGEIGIRARVSPEHPTAVEVITSRGWEKAVELKGMGAEEIYVAPSQVYGYPLGIESQVIKTAIKGQPLIISSLQREARAKLAASTIFLGGKIGVQHAGRFKDVSDLLRAQFTRVEAGYRSGILKPSKYRRGISIIETQAKTLGITYKTAEVGKPIMIAEPTITTKPSPSFIVASTIIPLPISPSISPKISPKISPYISPSISPSPFISPKISPYISPSISPSPFYISPSISPSPFISPKISPYISPKISPYIRPSISPLVSPSISPMISPSISPYISPSPSISPKISPYISPSPGGVLPVFRLYKMPKRAPPKVAYKPSLYGMELGARIRKAPRFVAGGVVGIRPMVIAPRARPSRAPTALPRKRESAFGFLRRTAVFLGGTAKPPIPTANIRMRMPSFTARAPKKRMADFRRLL